MVSILSSNRYFGFSMISPKIKTPTVQRGASTVQPHDDRLLLRGGEVATLLGISRALAFRWMQEGVLPVVRIPGARTVRVPKKELDDWILANTAAGVRGFGSRE